MDYGRVSGVYFIGFNSLWNMARYKVIDVEVKNWNDKEFKQVVVSGDAGETYGDNGTLTIWKSPYNSAGYNMVVDGGEIECEIVPAKNGKGFNLSFPRAKAGTNRDYDGEEKRRSQRIAFLSSTDKAIEIVCAKIIAKEPLDIDKTKAMVIGLRDWLLTEYYKFEKTVK